MVGEAGCVEQDEGGELWDVDCKSCPRHVGCVVDMFALKSVDDEFQKPGVVEFGWNVPKVVKTQFCAVVNEHDGGVLGGKRGWEEFCFVNDSFVRRTRVGWGQADTAEELVDGGLPRSRGCHFGG